MKIFQELKSSTNKQYLTIYYDEQENWIYNSWNGYVTPENIKHGSLAVLEAFRHFRTPYSLNDNQELVGTWDQSIDWIEKEWMPAAVDAGLRYYAHVVDQEAFAAASAAKMLSRVNGLFIMQIFSNTLDARLWLGSCKKVASRV